MVFRANRKLSDSKLPQVMIGVPVAQHSPCCRRQGSECGMIRQFATRIRLEGFDVRADCGFLHGPVQLRATDELLRGRHTSGKRKPVNKELLDRCVTNDQVARLDGKIAFYHQHPPRQVGQHFRCSHSSPEGSLVGRESIEASEKLFARARVP